MKEIKINLSNYEEFALDYLEDKLNAQEKLAFEDFLELHTDKRAELQEISFITLPPMEITLPNKERLYKKKKSRPLFLFPIGIAASLALLICFGLFLNKEGTTLTNTNSSLAVEEESLEQINLIDNEKTDLDEEDPINDVVNDAVSENEYVLEQQNENLIEVAVVDEVYSNNPGPAEPSIIGKPIKSDITQSSIQQSPYIVSEDMLQETEMETFADDKNNTSIKAQSVIIADLGRKEILEAPTLMPSLLSKNLMVAPQATKKNYQKDIASQISRKEINILTPTPRENRNKITGKLAFANISVSLIPTYFKKS